MREAGRKDASRVLPAELNSLPAPPANLTVAGGTACARVPVGCLPAILPAIVTSPRSTTYRTVNFTTPTILHCTQPTTGFMKMKNHLLFIDLFILFISIELFLFYKYFKFGFQLFKSK
jgi:hypothetical protein